MVGIGLEIDIVNAAIHKHDFRIISNVKLDFSYWEACLIVVDIITSKAITSREGSTTTKSQSTNSDVRSPSTNYGKTQRIKMRENIQLSISSATL